MREDVYVGVDVAKDTIDVALGPQGEVFTLPNSAAGFGALIERLKEFLVTLVVMEATGGYEEQLADALRDAAATRWRWLTRARCAISPGRLGSWPKRIGSMQA